MAVTDSASRALDSSGVREGNLALVLGAVLDAAPVSQPTLVEVTGLKKPTISSLVEELHRSGWVRPSGERQGALGRPRQLWAPDPDRGLVVSGQISVGKVAVLVVDFAGDVRAERSVTVDVSGWNPNQALTTVAGMIGSSLTDVGQADGHERPVLGVALAVPGVVSERGELRYAPGLSWDAADLVGPLRTALSAAVPVDCPVLVDNEANLATLAEYHRGRNAGVRDLVYILGEQGVGAGVVLDGKLFRGAHRSGGEVGHVTIDLDGPRCPCGKRGCWALYVGEEALRTQALEARSAGRASDLWEHRPPAQSGAVTSSDVLAAATEGDAVAMEGMARLRRYVAAGIGNLVSMYDPEMVVLGGFLRSAFTDSLDELRAEVGDWLMGGQGHADLRIELAELGSDAARWGGVVAVLHAITAQPRLLATAGA